MLSEEQKEETIQPQLVDEMQQQETEQNPITADSENVKPDAEISEKEEAPAEETVVAESEDIMAETLAEPVVAEAETVNVGNENPAEEESMPVEPVEETIAESNSEPVVSAVTEESIVSAEHESAPLENTYEQPVEDNAAEPVPTGDITEEPLAENTDEVKAEETTEVEEAAIEPEVKAEEETEPALAEDIITGSDEVETPLASIEDVAEESPEDLVEEAGDHEYSIGAIPVESADYATYGKEQLVELVENASKQDDLNEAFSVAKEAKVYFERLVSEEQEQALAAFLESGNEKDDFAPKPDEHRQRFFDAYKKIQARRADNRVRLEEEKLKNLATKKNMLERLKELTETDETADSLEKVKEIQNEWKKIRAVPKENVQQLWDSYRYFMDKFYDNLSINNELKELDRKKNLEIKIDLCVKVDQLQEEESITKALNMLNKYHDEWKHTGPVPREYSEEIWLRFKGASDKIFEQKRALLDEINAQREKNLELKTALVEKLEMAATAVPDRSKDWVEKTQEINELFEEWKKIGPVPNEHNETIWKKFKDIRNTFFRQKNNFFKGLNKTRMDNLALKYNICEQAESLKDSEDWMKTTNELIRLQNDWKKIGQVPDKMSDDIWKRFRAACDSFFARKEEHFKGQKEDQNKSLEIKKGLIEQLKALGEKQEVEQVMNELKDIQKSWSSAGFVPIKFKDDLHKEYTALVDALYKKFRRNNEAAKEGRMKDHYGEIAQTDDGKKRLQTEERKIREKIRFLKNDIETLENNIGFFSNSKTAGPLIAGIQEKIKKTTQQVANLEKELGVIKKMA